MTLWPLSVSPKALPSPGPYAGSPTRTLVRCANRVTLSVRASAAAAIVCAEGASGAAHSGRYQHTQPKRRGSIRCVPHCHAATSEWRRTLDETGATEIHVVCCVACAWVTGRRAHAWRRRRRQLAARDPLPPRRGQRTFPAGVPPRRTTRAPAAVRSRSRAHTRCMSPCKARPRRRVGVGLQGAPVIRWGMVGGDIRSRALRKACGAPTHAR